MKKLLAILLIAGSAITAFAGCGCRSCPAKAKPACPSCNTYNEEKAPTCCYWKSVQMQKPACKHVQVNYTCPLKTGDGYTLEADHNGSMKGQNVPPSVQHLIPSK